VGRLAGGSRGHGEHSDEARANNTRDPTHIGREEGW